MSITSRRRPHEAAGGGGADSSSFSQLEALGISFPQLSWGDLESALQESEGCVGTGVLCPLEIDGTSRCVWPGRIG